MDNPLRLSNKKIKYLDLLPSNSGIYKFLDSKKEVLYIGKAKDLRKRIKSFFSKSKGQSQKIRRLNSESIYLEITEGNYDNALRKIISIEKDSDINNYLEEITLIEGEIYDYILLDYSKAADLYLNFLELFPQSIYYDLIRLRLRELAS